MKKNILIIMPTLIGLQFPGVAIQEVTPSPTLTPVPKAISPTIHPSSTPSPITSNTVATVSATSIQPLSATPTLVPPAAELTTTITPSLTPTAKTTPTPSAALTPTPTLHPTSPAPSPKVTPSPIPLIQSVATKTYDTIINAPRDLINHAVNSPVYLTQGISQKNSALLLATAFLCISCGTYLLKDKIRNKFLKKL